MGNKKYYIDNKEFEALLLAYKENPKENEDELVKMFDLLITNIIGSFNFKIDPDDAKQDCFALILKIIKNFTPKKGTAFNYFTTIIVNNLKLLYTKEKKYKLKIEKFIEMQSKKLD
jgi:DNA-directed RNA polymerase specialized sigma subunit